MHNLSGVFLQIGDVTELEGKKFFCFVVVYPKKNRYYYVEKKEEFDIWVEKIKKATGYSSLTDIYDVKGKLGNGKFGLVKLGVNKINGNKVAVKIMSKAEMSDRDKELVATEIDIMKICKHPNIVHLYEIFENLDYYYISKIINSHGILFRR